MTDHLKMLASLCGSAGPGGGAGLYLALLLAGAVGGAAHCVPMCGPFVLAQVSGALARVSAARLCESRRVGAGLLPPYHLGRICTYATLGALAAGSGGALRVLPFSGWLPGAFLLVGAALFLSQAVRRLAPKFHPLSARNKPVVRPGAAHKSIVARLAGRIDRTRPAGGFWLGVVLGFLPCGFLYAALAVAAATGGPARGALAMGAFGLGTAGSLTALGVAGHAGGRTWTRAMAAIGPALLVFNAAVLTVLAWQRFAALG